MVEMTDLRIAIVRIAGQLDAIESRFRNEMGELKKRVEGLEAHLGLGYTHYQKFGCVACGNPKLSKPPTAYWDQVTCPECLRHKE